MPRSAFQPCFELAATRDGDRMHKDLEQSCLELICLRHNHTFGRHPVTQHHNFTRHLSELETVFAQVIEEARNQ